MLSKHYAAQNVKNFFPNTQITPITNKSPPFTQYQFQLCIQSIPMTHILIANQPRAIQEQSQRLHHYLNSFAPVDRYYYYLFKSVHPVLTCGIKQIGVKLSTSLCAQFILQFDYFRLAVTHFAEGKRTVKFLLLLLLLLQDSMFCFSR